MKTTKERIPQLKTLEVLVCYALTKAPERDEQLLSAYNYVYNHFADEDFLHDLTHKSLLQSIYIRNFYKNHNVSSLGRVFHEDNKKITQWRKTYLHLLSKQYFGFEADEEHFRILLFEALARYKKACSSKKRR